MKCYVTLLQALALYSLEGAYAQPQNHCNITFKGSVTRNEHKEYLLDVSENITHSNNSFIRLSTCSSQTQFDTVLYLLDEDRTNTIDMCDDICSITANTQNCHSNTRFNHQTIWDLNLENLAQTNYVLQIRGYQGEVDAYIMTVSHDCNMDISITPIPYSSTTPVVRDASSILNIDSAETVQSDKINQQRIINLIIVIAVISIHCCGTILFCTWRCYEEKEVDPFFVFYNNPKMGRALKVCSQVIIS